MTSRRFAVLAMAMFALYLSPGCSGDGIDMELPEPNGEEFAQSVYPVLLRDCGTSTCHGSEARFFRVVGPGRTRLFDTQDPLEPATPQEILESFRRARAMLAPDAGDRPLLLRKPLALEAGGATHGGTDAYGRNVYPSRRDPNYRILEHWVKNARGGDE